MPQRKGRRGKVGSLSEAKKAQNRGRTLGQSLEDKKISKEMKQDAARKKAGKEAGGKGRVHPKVAKAASDEYIKKGMKAEQQKKKTKAAAPKKKTAPKPKSGSMTPRNYGTDTAKKVVSGASKLLKAGSGVAAAVTPKTMGNSSAGTSMTRRKEYGRHYNPGTVTPTPMKTAPTQRKAVNIGSVDNGTPRNVMNKKPTPASVTDKSTKSPKSASQKVTGGFGQKTNLKTRDYSKSDWDDDYSFAEGGPVKAPGGAIQSVAPKQQQMPTQQQTRPIQTTPLKQPTLLRNNAPRVGAVPINPMKRR